MATRGSFNSSSTYKTFKQGISDELPVRIVDLALSLLSLVLKVQISSSLAASVLLLTLFRVVTISKEGPTDFVCGFTSSVSALALGCHCFLLLLSLQLCPTT